MLLFLDRLEWEERCSCWCGAGKERARNENATMSGTERTTEETSRSGERFIDAQRRGPALTGPVGIS